MHASQLRAQKSGMKPKRRKMFRKVAENITKEFLQAFGTGEEDVGGILDIGLEDTFANRQEPLEFDFGLWNDFAEGEPAELVL